MLSSYLLVDTTLIDESCEKLWLKKERYPTWIATVYGRDAAEVSPIIIDIQQAIKFSKISAIMKIINSKRPQLGISIIESTLSLEHIVRHFRNFIYVRTKSGKDLTLRFADCAVLPSLAAVFEAKQWAALTAPFESWKIHDRDGNLFPLPISNQHDLSSTPLTLTQHQVSTLRETMAADQLLFHLRMQRPADPSLYLTAIAHRYATQCRHMWHEAGNVDDVDLVSFAGYVFDTEGSLLDSPHLLSILAERDRKEREEFLKKIINS